LPHQVGRLAAQNDFRSPQVGRQFVQSGLIQRSKLLSTESAGFRYSAISWGGLDG
jgi:hypothetical protein